MTNNEQNQKKPFRTLSTKQIYASNFWQLNVDRYTRTDGSEGEYVWANSTHGAALTVLRAPDNKFLLIHQYRYPSQRWLWECVAGGCEPGEAAIDTAIRETREEVGLTVNSIAPLGSYLPISGLTANRFYAFVAEIDYVPADQIKTQLSEGIVAARWFTGDELRQAVASNQIECGGTLTALSMYWANYPPRD